MNWGDKFTTLYNGASDAAKASVDGALSSVKKAGDLVSNVASTVADSAGRAVNAAGKAIDSAGHAIGDAAKATGDAVVSAGRVAGTAAVETAKGAGRVVNFAGRAVGETAVTTVKAVGSLTDKTLERAPLVGGVYKGAKNLLVPAATPREKISEPCPNSWEAKKQRLEERNALISQGNGPGADQAHKAAAARLAKNNEAVELARLSEDTYAQFKNPPVNKPPIGWSKLSDEEIKKSGIDPDLLQKSKAVIYKTPADWPGGAKTVLAFRGTVPTEMDDLKTNLDQALGVETVQYNASVKLGEKVANKLGSSTLVTGHSLGGGKAQAAGVSGGLKGTMFNSAGLNDTTVPDLKAAADQFQQFRAPHDPLTKLQNSAALQTGVGALVGGVVMPLGAGVEIGTFAAKSLGMPTLSPEAIDIADKATGAFPRALGNLVSQGNLLPVAKGKITEVPSLDDKGNPIAATNLLEQHSVHNVVNGIEQQKSEDIATLRK